MRIRRTPAAGFQLSQGFGFMGLSTLAVAYSFRSSGKG